MGLLGKKKPKEEKKEELVMPGADVVNAAFARMAVCM